MVKAQTDTKVDKASLKPAQLEPRPHRKAAAEPDKGGYCRQLTDIKGVGESAANKIEERMIEFWAQNPQGYA